MPFFGRRRRRGGWRILILAFAACSAPAIGWAAGGGPAAPRIVSCDDDTGVPNDHITSDTTLVLRGTAEAGARVTLFENGSTMSAVTAAADGSWSFARSNLGYPSGKLAFTAVATDGAGRASEASEMYEMLICPPLRALNVTARAFVGAEVRFPLPIIDGQGQLVITVTDMPPGLTYYPDQHVITGSVGQPGVYRMNFDVTGQTSSHGTITLTVDRENEIAPPDGIAARAADNAQVNLAWTAEPGGTTASVVERSVDGMAFSALATLSGTATAYSDTTAVAGTTYYYRVRYQFNGDSATFTNLAEVTASGLSPTGNPTATRGPANTLITYGSRAALNVDAGASGNSIQWQRNGAEVPGATAATLMLDGVPEQAGIYRALVINGGITPTQPAILGLLLTGQKSAGACAQVGSDIRHYNGNVYDQILLQGGAASLTADRGQVTRLSFCDLNGDIVQVEFAGAGTLTIGLDDASAPAAAGNYNQPGISYVRGHATLVVAGADETTNLSVFTVGRMTALNQALFRDDVNYDGVADIAAIAILSSNGRFGGLRAADADCFAGKGVTGVFAPNVRFDGPCYIGNISAHDGASGVLQLGSCDDVKITGGDLAQANGGPLVVSGLTTLQFVPGSNSHGKILPAMPNRARFVDPNGADVSANITIDFRP